MPYVSFPTTYETHKDILVSGGAVIATYTVDADYVTDQTMANGTTRKVAFEGTVMALNGDLAVPNYSTYGFPVLGVLLQAVDVNDGDEVAPIVLRGDVAEKYCYDNGTYGSVLSATKNSLQHRILFAGETRL